MTGRESPPERTDRPTVRRTDRRARNARPRRLVAKAVELSWLSRFWTDLRGLIRGEPPRRDLDATEDFPVPSSLTLVPGVYRLRVGVVSTVGNHREHNEDNFFVPGRRSIVHGGSTEASGEMPAATTLEVLKKGSNGAESANTGRPAPHLGALPLFIVADGMGGQQAGEEASRMAVELIPKAVSRRLPDEEGDAKTVQTAIRGAVADANHEILGSSGTVPQYTNMGTTVVLAMFRNDKAYVAGIGDSRAYRLRAGELEQLTKDHSLADALLEAGTITKEDLPHHKFKNILYLYLGSKDAGSGPEDVRVLDVRQNDRFLLASDGLTGVVTDADIARVLATVDDPQRAAKTLKDMALANDSKDNVTCLVVHVVGEGDPDSGRPA